MISVSYRNFTGTGAENYQRYFVPSRPAPTSIGALTRVFCSAPGRIRTCDARFRKPTLYPLSYGGG